MTRYKRIKFCVVISAILSLAFFSAALRGNSVHFKSKVPRDLETASRSFSSESPSLVSPLVIVVCDGENSTDRTESLLRVDTNRENDKKAMEYLRVSWRRQAEQITTMFKTLLYFSRSPKWRVLVLTDSMNTFRKVQDLVNKLSEGHSGRLILERRKQWYPSEYPQLISHWRPCSWAKAFLAEALPDEDAVIYVDTDLVFLAPPEQLWQLLKSMDERQALSFAPEPFYMIEKPFRYPAGQVGLNTGVMAANLTRLRKLPNGGLGSAIIGGGAILPEPRHDQDAINYFLKQRPEMLYEVTSRWNFIPSTCMRKGSPCEDCTTSGILILHGADASFYRFIDKKFLMVYANLVKMTPNEDPRKLLAALDSQLALIDKQKHIFPCSNYTDFNYALTVGLVDKINN